MADIRNFVVQDQFLSRSVATMLGCNGKRNIIGRNERLFLAKSHCGEKHKESGLLNSHIRLDTSTSSFD
jgi:hypothetical protein